MKKDTLIKINRIEQEGLDITSKKLMVASFEVYKKTFLVGGLIILGISLFLVSVTVFYLQYQQIEIDPILEQVLNLNLHNFSLNSIFLYVAVMTIAVAIGNVFIAGMIQINAQSYLQKKWSWTMAFRYFLKKEGWHIFGAYLLISLLFITASTLLQLQNLNLVSMILNWIINSLTALVTPLILFAGLNPLQAIKQSARIINKQPLTLVSHIIWINFLSSIGVLVLGVGVFFTLPFIYSFYFTLYNQTMGIMPEENRSTSETNTLND